VGFQKRTLSLSLYIMRGSWVDDGEGKGGRESRQVDIRLPGKGNSNSHGARPFHLIISMTKWIRTSRSSIKNSLSRDRLRTKREVAFKKTRVQGSGFRVQGSGFRVQGSGFRVQGSGFRVLGPGKHMRIEGGETAYPWDPTVALCLGPYGRPRGGAVSYERSTPVGEGRDRCRAEAIPSERRAASCAARTMLPAARVQGLVLWFRV